MTVTVAMPYWNVPDLVGRAVRSVLAQTHRDLRLIVIGDGQEPPLGDLDDSRLTVYILPENRGTYYALQLALLASPDEWHAPHGADDWTEPDHLESLVSVGKDAVALGTTWVNGQITSIGKEGWHVGLFSSARLKELGGYDPTARLSQDTNVLKLLDMTGGYYRHQVAHPTYHVNRRAGSLTTQPSTGMSSQRRQLERLRDAKIRSVCRRLGTPAQMGAFRRSLVPSEVAEELAADVSRLRTRLN